MYTELVFFTSSIPRLHDIIFGLDLCAASKKTHMYYNTTIFLLAVLASLFIRLEYRATSYVFVCIDLRYSFPRVQSHDCMTSTFWELDCMLQTARRRIN
jgi:hypothetical protein